MGFAATHLVYHSYRGTPVLVGYYALANKSVSIKGSTLNRRWRSRLNRFARYDYDAKQYSISLPLIGQLGKNFENENNRLITGDQLLAFACNKVREAQRIGALHRYEDGQAGVHETDGRVEVRGHAEGDEAGQVCEDGCGRGK